jgi:hypothetical protein
MARIKRATRPRGWLWFAVVKEQATAREQRNGVVAKGRLPSQAVYNGRRAFVRLFMWRSAGHMLSAYGGQPDGAKAFFNPSPRPSRRIGDVHLCLEYADLETVTHELTHALVNRIKMHGPDAVDVIAQRVNGSHGYGRRAYFFAGRADEEIAYEMGRWVLHGYVWVITVLKKRRLL